MSRITDELKGLPAFCVRRPVFAIVINLLVIIAGLAAIMAGEIRELPSTDRPVVTIRTTYSGATPETVDTTVTSVLEGAGCADAGRRLHILEIKLRLQPHNSRIRIVRRCRHGGQ